MAVLDSAEKSFAIINMPVRFFGVVWDNAGIDELDSNQLLGIEREFAANSRSTVNSDPDPGVVHWGSGSTTRPRRIRA